MFEIERKSRKPNKKEAWIVGSLIASLFLFFTIFSIFQASDSVLTNVETALVTKAKAMQSSGGRAMSSSLTYELELQLANGTLFNTTTHLKHEVGDIACVSTISSKSKGHEYNKIVQPKSWCKDL
ncbi:hypothetical protein [Marinibactrum halimedae]|uniref:Uncharacterized protein n=1 Tax=Marinibactrum halimedae TaxID=1444977 RepID=A0AA37T461_9GAMM|nr:hypothetical protein [Marinibactrum halimedae]MCD9457829.1 hypothetical protein [Marinibactrum halimedae]GLS24797.1 hypothetical protein GCM10007877_05110 [Marinibactrum halimedae]